MTNRGRKARSGKRRWMLPAAIAVVALIILGSFFLFGSSGSDAAERDDLEAEFWGAYLATAAGGGPTVKFDMTAAPATLELVEGVATEVWAYNGTVPGEELRLTIGDTIELTLKNELPVPTTLHFHGSGIPNEMDGFPEVTQDAVAPGESFVYTFTPREPGTYYYHPSTNSTEQLERGLYGVLVVEDDIDAQYSQDVVWVIDDWSLDGSGQIDPFFNAPTDVTHNGRWGDLETVNGSPNEVLQVQPGERLRLRLVNASVARVYGIRFPGLPAQLIAVDSFYVRTPRSADATLLAPGERFDVDIVVPDEPGTYEIFDDWAPGSQKLLGTIVVEGDVVETPDFVAPSNPAVPTWDLATDIGVDIEYKFVFQGGQWTINGKAYPDPDVQNIEPEQFTRIRFNNISDRIHPMHLHGQSFKLIEKNGEPIDEGFFRDSVLLLPNDVIDVGLVAIDAGTWVLQCHIMEHTAAGMVSLVEVVPS